MGWITSRNWSIAVLLLTSSATVSVMGAGGGQG